MRARGNSPNFYVIGFVCIILFAILVFVLYKILSAIALGYATKNREKLLLIDEKLSKKINKEASLITKFYQTYNTAVETYGFNRTIRCSSSVVSSASINPIKYALKYSNTSNSTKDLEVLEFMRDFCEKYHAFVADLEDMGYKVRDQLPLIHRIFVNKKLLPYTICNIDASLKDINTAPRIKFQYISPAGKSGRSCKIDIDDNMLAFIISEISESLTKKGHKRAQRAAMTNDLREAIKKRDNYTCCKCGNSVYEEPNLLLEVDHIVPISKGGKTEADNLQTLCWRCNRLKGNKEE